MYNPNEFPSRDQEAYQNKLIKKSFDTLVYFVVSLAVMFVAVDHTFGKLFVGDLSPLVERLFVKPCVQFQARRRSSAGD